MRFPGVDAVSRIPHGTVARNDSLTAIDPCVGTLMPPTAIRSNHILEKRFGKVPFQDAFQSSRRDRANASNHVVLGARVQSDLLKFCVDRLIVRLDFSLHFCRDALARAASRRERPTPRSQSPRASANLHSFAGTRLLRSDRVKGKTLNHAPNNLERLPRQLGSEEVNSRDCKKRRTVNVYTIRKTKTTSEQRRIWKARQHSTKQRKVLTPERA